MNNNNIRMLFDYSIEIFQNIRDSPGTETCILSRASAWSESESESESGGEKVSLNV